MSDSYSDHLYALFLAGGGGTRLWPRSRNKTPKQFLKLFENKTLTQITSKRFNKILPWERIFAVTVSEEYKKEILKEVPQFKSENILVEPARRDTGPAHGFGASYIYKKDPEAVIITESADRMVEPISRYLSTLKKAAKVAYEEKVMVAIGVKPRYPHTGYGYIKRSEKKLESANGKFYKIEKFTEKPSLVLARKYMASNKYYWNAGQYVWRADVILSAIRKHNKKIASSLSKITDSIGTSQEREVIAREYKKMPKISVDYAVAEKAKNMFVSPGDFFWTDIGDWKEVWNNLKKDESGNVVIGENPKGKLMNLGSGDSLVYKNGRLVVLINVENLIVVDTEDALLVCSKSRAQDVKKIVEELKKKNKKEYL